ncbi:MAG: hypothetical protein KDI42_10365, partial [Gammaproteobacteria bacterium]|nr:hypothetical protein [Gammaproteobacteria bacterium]
PSLHYLENLKMRRIAAESPAIIRACRSGWNHSRWLAKLDHPLPPLHPESAWTISSVDSTTTSVPKPAKA